MVDPLPSPSVPPAPAPSTVALIIGDQAFYPALCADGRPFVFNRPQNEFLIAFDKMQSIPEACFAINKSEEWAKSFLGSRKFRAFRNAKLQEISARNGISLEKWHQFAQDAMRGYQEWYEGTCEICHESPVFTMYEAESFRQDDMSMKAKCPICFQGIAVEYKAKDFHPTREQVVIWQEMGARLSPKVERVQHQFATETFVFQPQEAS